MSQSYNRHTWAKGTVITSLWLNEMEAGIDGNAGQIEAMDYQDDGSDYGGAVGVSNGYFVKKVSQTDGKIKVEREQFNPTFSSTAGDATTAQKFSLGLNNTTSNTVTLTTATTGVYGVTKLNSSTVTNGALSSNADMAVTALGVKNAIESLGVSDTPVYTQYVSGVSETNGKISVSRESFNPQLTWDLVPSNNKTIPRITFKIGTNNANVVSVDPQLATIEQYGVTQLTNTTVSGGTLSNDQTLAVTCLGVKNAIESLDVADTAVGTQYVSGVSETDGKISVSRANFSPSLNPTAGTNEEAQKLNITVAGNSMAQPISLTIATEGSSGVYGVTKLSNATNSQDTNVAATPKAVNDVLTTLNTRIDNLDTTISNTSGKTVDTITEENGVVSATFQDIEIVSSQIIDGNQANQVLKLNNDGLVDSTFLPSYVDDILEGSIGANNSIFYDTNNDEYDPEVGKIYVDTNTNTSYRWSGSQYTKVASDLSLGETSATAYAGDKGKQAYDWASRAYTHAGASPQYTAATSGLYRITVNNEGHVTATAAVQASDITGLLGTAAVKDVASSGNASATQIVMGNDSRLTDARNAADVSAWAKAATKPTYTATEVGVPLWAQASTKPSYTAAEVGALADDTVIPDNDDPVFTNTITIGSTTITEAQLQALLAMLPQSEPEQEP